jgi:putative PIN family toxin of toxin-antitoxin system
MQRERVVLDTNVLISGSFSRTSTPALAVQFAIEHGQLLASSESLRELMDKQLAEKFDAYVAPEKREALLMRLAPLVEIVEIVQSCRASRDPEDDKFLEVAVNGRAEVLVTGDKDLLALGTFRGVAILTPADCLVRSSKEQSS